MKYYYLRKYVKPSNQLKAFWGLLVVFFSLMHLGAMAQNILPNGDFESGTLHWVPSTGGYVVETVDVRSGTKAVKVVSPGSAGGTQDISTLLEPNTKYQVSAYAKNREVGVGSNQVGLIFRSNSGSDNYNLGKLNYRTETTYTLKTSQFVTPEEWQNARIRFWKEDAGNNFFVDDIKIEKVPDTRAPNKVDGLSGYAKETAVIIKYNKPFDDVRTVSFEIFRNGVKVGATANTYFTSEGLTPNTAYTFTVVALDQAGNRSVASNPLVITTGTPTPVAQAFTVSGSKILRADGSEFIIKGTNVNGPHWPWKRETTQDAALIDNIWGFNSVRVNFYSSLRSTFLSNNPNLDLIVNTFTSRGIVTQIEEHSYTGRYPTEIEIETLKDFWVDKAFRYRNNPYVWFNIMNEPGSNTAIAPEDWKTMHEEIIQAIRNAGADNIIILDGHQFGQENGFANLNPAGSAILTYGEYFTQTYQNIIFSFHVYDRWSNGQERFNAYLDAIQAKGLSVHVGEYGRITNATAPMFNAILSRNIGSMVWHWDGGDDHDLVEGGVNGGGFEIDRTDGAKPGNLSWLGNLVWHYNRGTLVPFTKDLAVTDIIPLTGQFEAGAPMKLAANVRNLGLVALEAGSKLKIKFTLNGQPLSEETVNAPLDLSAGITVVSDEFITPGTQFEVKAEIDLEGSSYGTDAVAANNSLVKNLNGAAATNGFDLVVTDISVGTSDSLAFNQSIPLTAVVKNVGTVASPAGTLSIAFKVDGEIIKTVTNTSVVAPGATVSVSSTPWVITKSKSFPIAATVAHSAPETNPGNNSSFENFIMFRFINLIKNPSFEENLTSWSNWGRLSVTSVASEVQRGTKALKVSAGGAGGGGQNLNLEPNSYYRFSGYGKNDATPAPGTDVGIQYNLPSGQKAQHVLRYSETEYTFKEVYFKTPAEFTAANVFIWKASAGTNFFADNLNLVKLEIGDCTVPQNLAATTLTDSSATLAWTPVSSAIRYEVGYKIGYTDEMQWVSTKTASVTVSKLFSGMPYAWQVRAICSDKPVVVSDLSEVATFTTTGPVGCAPPGSISVICTTNNSLGLTWNGQEATGAGTFDIAYRVAGTTDWFIQTTYQNEFVAALTGLRANTAYEVKIKANCDDQGFVYSVYSPVFTFKTTTKDNRVSCEEQMSKKPLLPVLECVTRNADGTSTATFSHKNNNILPIQVPVGDNNYFYPGNKNRNQPVVFMEGHKVGAFSVTYSEPVLEWHLNGHVVVVGADAKICAAPKARLAQTGDAGSANTLSLLIAPNPVEGGLVQVSSSENMEKATLVISDLVGRTFPVSFVKVNANQLEVNVAGLKPGIYLLTVSTNKSQTTEKIVIKP